MSNNEQQSKMWDNAKYEITGNTIEKDGERIEIIPITELKVNELFEGMYLGLHYYPSKKAFTEEQKKLKAGKIKQDDTVTWTAHKFEKRSGDVTIIFPSHQLNKALEKKAGCLFQITFTGKSEIKGTNRTVKNYIIKVAGKPSPTQEDDLPF